MYPLGDNENDLNTLLRSSDFDAWLSNLADQKAKARILARITSATFGISAIANLLAKASRRCAFVSDRDIEFITLERDRPFMFYWLAV